jgi:hypothetical protein
MWEQGKVCCEIINYRVYKKIFRFLARARGSILANSFASFSSKGACLVTKETFCKTIDNRFHAIIYSHSKDRRALESTARDFPL